MSTKPEVPPESPSRRPRRRRGWLRLGWIGRRRPAAGGPAAGAPAVVGPRLLFLDDDPARAACFLAEYPEAVWVTNVPDCLARLAGPWDEVHLDHDLGGKTFVNSADTDCGMEVIRWLCKEPREHLRNVSFFVHTHNVAAGLLMVLQMRAGGYRAEFRPFGLDLKRLLAHNEPGAEPPKNRRPEAESDPESHPVPSASPALVIGLAGRLQALGRSWRSRLRSRKSTESR